MLNQPPTDRMMRKGDRQIVSKRKSPLAVFSADRKPITLDDLRKARAIMDANISKPHTT